MLTNIAPFLAALLVPSGLTFPYPFTNTTAPNNSIDTNATTPLPRNVTVPELKCNYIYSSDLTVLNERYPDYNTTHLHATGKLFMLRREVPEIGEIATRVQFQGLPSNTSNTTCRLEFVLPKPGLQVVEGFNPTFDTYQVERDTESISTWKQYVGNTEGAELFGRVNGEPEALERTRSVGGVAAINETMCNETLTFQMGMAFNGKNGMPNYWNFVQVAPPAWPEQGFRMVWGC
jgi:hypothetical protein